MKRLLPPTYLFLATATMVFLHWLLPLTTWLVYPWNLFGLIPLLTGIVLNLLADAALKKLNTTVKPFEASSTLITSGVYRVCRHPMYLGMVMILLGLAMLHGSVTPLLVVGVFGLLMEWVFVQPEEHKLAQAFGETWRSYCHSVRKWL